MGEAMSFFEMPPSDAAARREPEPRRRRWVGDDADTVGVPVALTVLLAKTEEVAVAVSGVLVFPTGFSFSLITLCRMDPPRVELRRIPGPPWRANAESTALRFGIGFADGTKTTNLAPPGPLPQLRGPSPAPRLSTRSGGGGERKFTQGFYCSPLPPAGPMRFVCEWVAAAIEETEVTIEATLIRSAAAQAHALWPEDAELPPDEDGRRLWPWRS